MKTTIMKLLSMLLCFEMIIAPVAGSLVLTQKAFAEDPCASRPGTAWNSDVGRCLTKDEVVRVNNATASCGSDRECYKTNAQTELDKAIEDNGDLGKNDSFHKDDGSGKEKGIVKAGNVATIAIPTLIATSVLLRNKKDTPKCNPPSLLLMYGAAAALAAGEIVGYFNHKAKLKKIRDNWDKANMPSADSGTDKKRTEQTEAQSQAFEFLAQNEEQVAKTAKLKKGFYLASTGLFAAGAIAAVVEQVQLSMARTQEMTARAQIADPNVKDKASAYSMLQRSQNTIKRVTCSAQNIADKNKDAKTSKKLDEREKELNDKKAELNKDPVKNKDQIDKIDKELGDISNQKSSLKTGLDDYNKELNKPKVDPAANNGGGTGSSQQNGNNSGGNNNKFNANNLAGIANTAAGFVKGGGKNSENSSTQTNSGNSNNQEFPDMNGWSESNETKSECVGDKDADRTWQHDRCWQKPPTTGLFFKDSKLEKVAIHNISTATDAEQLVQLMKEYESIEFENYSKTSYFEEEIYGELKKTKIEQQIAKVIADTFVTPAHAVETLPYSANSNFIKFDQKTSELIPNDVAKGPEIVINQAEENGKPISPSKLAAIKNQVSGYVIKMISKPVTRIAINGVLGGWMGIQSAHMANQAKLSMARADKLRSIKSDFASSNGIMFCKEQDRDDSSKPSCYCFTADNKPNPARTKSKICDTAYKGLSTTSGSQETGGAKVCVTQSYTTDPSCSCRQSNTCLKTTKFTAAGFNPGTFKMISAGGAPANDLFNGNASGGDIYDSAGVNAARIKAAADEMLAKADPKAAKESSNMAKQLENSLLAATSGLGMSGSGGSSSLPSSPAAAAAALDKELEDKKDDIDVTTAGEGGPTAAPTATEEQPEFGMTEDQLAAQETEIAEVMNQEMDMGNNDINSGSKTNIFEVLSNRYQRSGMRRLFDENGKTKADEAAKTDISE